MFFDYSTSIAIGLSCFAFGVVAPQVVTAQSNMPTPLRQTREQIAALPTSQGTAPAARFASAVVQNEKQRGTGQYHSSNYPQSTAQSNVYPYPAAMLPQSGRAAQSRYGLSQNNATARLSTQMAPGANTPTGNLNGQSYGNAPVYNLNYATPAATNANATPSNPNSRSPVEQQRSSTLSQARTASLSGNGSNQGQLNNQANQASAQPTTAYRQSAYQQPTLGLGNPQFRTAQNCTCAPGYNPVANYNPTAAAYQAPSLNPNVGQGLGVPPLNIQVPGQTGSGQAVYQPNYQFQQNVGTPQFGAQGASWWTPFVSGSGVYTPLLKLRNMPAGTYLGQGIIGQPTAYVDGQPVRNLLRYVSP